MGMYTEIFVKASFDTEKVPNEVIEIIKYMVGQSTKENALDEIEVLGGHKLFTTQRWNWMLQCSSFNHQPESTRNFFYNDISKEWYLCVRSDFKDYDNESELFFDWVKKYVSACDSDDCENFIGYTLYEEDSVPKLYFVHGVSNESNA